MNSIKRLILLGFCNGEVRLKWLHGDLSSTPYKIHEAVFQMDHFSSHEYAEVTTGFFQGWRFQ